MEYRFNKTPKTIPPSASLAIGEKAKALKAAGYRRQKHPGSRFISS